MNHESPVVLSPPRITLAAAASAAVIAISLIGSVADLFLDAGTPFEQLAAAERDCVDRAYAWERAECIDAFVAASKNPGVAGL